MTRRLRSERLMQVMDASRAVADWHMKQGRRSPAYTTDWEDLPRAVAR